MEDSEESTRLIVFLYSLSSILHPRLSAACSSPPLPNFVNVADGFERPTLCHLPVRSR
jgi:hypothetical protein